MSTVVAFKPRQTAVLPNSKRFPFDIRVLCLGMDRAEAFRLRYKAYREVGYIPENPARRYSDNNDENPTTVLISAHDKSRCVGVLRVSLSTIDQPISTLPCAPYYPEVNHIKEIATGSVVEVGRLALDPDIDNTSYRTTLFASLVRAAFIAAQAAEASHILIAARAEATGFHTKMLGFKHLGSPAPYPPGHRPIALLVGTRSDAELKQKAQNAFFRITPEEVQSMLQALQPALNPHEFDEQHPAAATG